MLTWFKQHQQQQQQIKQSCQIDIGEQCSCKTHWCNPRDARTDEQFSVSSAEGPSLIAGGTTVRNKLDSFHYKQNLHLDFWTPRCLEFSQLPMVLRCGNLLDCHLNKEFPWSHVCSSEYTRNGHWMKFSHIIALISVNSGLDCLLQICEIFLTGVHHHLATIWHSLAGQTNVFWGEINITVDLFLYWWCLL